MNAKDAFQIALDCPLDKTQFAAAAVRAFAKIKEEAEKGHFVILNIFTAEDTPEDRLGVRNHLTALGYEVWSPGPDNTQICVSWQK